MDRTVLIARNHVAITRVVPPVTSMKLRDRAVVRCESFGTRLLRQQRPITTQERGSGNPVSIVPLESVLLIVDRDVVQVDLANDAAALPQFDRILDIGAREWLVGVLP